MLINKQNNQIAINNFKTNKYITKFDIVESINWIDPDNHSKGVEDVYEYTNIETNISSTNDLDIFMKAFLNSPLCNIESNIKHNITFLYTGNSFKIIEFTTRSLNNDGTITKKTDYKIIY